MSSPPRLLLLDIETSPSVVYTFDMWQANISADKVIEPSRMMCWAAKWYGEDEVFFRSTYHDGRDEMVAEIYRLMSEADALIHYNGKGFDVPHLHREFLLAGLTAPSPSKQIDLYLAIKKVFKFTHNGLGYVCQQLGLDSKLQHSGFDLWVKCLHDDPDAWAAMREYNIQDVQIMEPLYNRLQSWIPSHPSYAAMMGEDVCPACGSADLQRRGTTSTATGRFQRLRCTSCGRWSRSSKREAGTSITQIAA
jgi:hypothetical protein